MIEAALTAEEWAATDPDDRRRVGDDGQPLLQDGVLYVCYETFARQSVPADQLPALIALANDALPSDSEYKITRADVEALAFLLDKADFNDSGPYGEGWQSNRMASNVARTEALAAKLAALLRHDA